MSTRRERAKAQRRHGDITICHVSDAPQVEGVAVIVIFDIAGWLLIKRGNLKRKQV